MSNIKEKVIATAEQMRNAVKKTAGKVGHAAADALDKGDHAISKAARKAKDIAVETADKIKHKNDKTQDAASDEAHGAGEETKKAGN